MTLPTIPTDNLYKFLFVGGISLIITASALFSTQSQKLTKEIDVIEISQTKKLACYW